MAPWYHEFVADAQTSGALRSDRSAEDLAAVLSGATTAVVYRWLRRRRKSPLVDRAELVFDAFLNGAQAP